MIRRPGAYELILGMADDATFGPFMLFGHGGTAVEVIADKALGLPPLNLKLAQEMIQRTRIWHQLKGYRDRLPVAIDAIALTLVQISQLVCDFDEIEELDINPLLADERGVIAVDARIRVAQSDSSAIAHRRLAIRPYPQELESRETIAGLGEFRMRPVRPEDAPAFMRLSERLAPEDVRLRFFSPFKTLPPALLARLTQIDYDREMAFVLFDARNEVAGVGRFAADPDGARAEFAVLARSDLKGHGIGHLFMDRPIAYARSRGIGQLFGDTLVENEPMLALCRELGFNISTPSHGVVRVTLDL
jgi:acetyltransferase